MNSSSINNRRRHSSARSLAVCVVLVVCLSAISTRAQLPATPQHGFQPAGSFALSNIESINTANGNMMLRIPLASLPPGRGNSPGFQLNLSYNSKLYDSHIEQIPDPGTGQPVQQIHLNPSEQGGWHYNYANYALQLLNRIDVEGWTECVPGSCTGWLRNAYVYKLKVIFPDSGEHEFRPLGYTDSLNDGYYNINPNGLQWGTSCTVGGCNVASTQATTGGMSYYSTDGSFLRLDIPYSPTGGWMGNWTLSFSDGRKVVNTPTYQRTYDRHNNYTDRMSITHNNHPATKIVDQLGRAMIIEYAPGADYIYITGPNGEEVKWTVSWKTIYAYKLYRATTNGTQHGNIYPTTGSNNPVVVSQIILPSQTGSLAYTFGYNAPDTDPYPNYSYGWGELSSITLPSGAQASYAWTFDGAVPAQGPLTAWVLQSAITQKNLTYSAQYDGSSTPITDTWTYSAPMNYGTSMTITGPDGGITRNYSANTGPFARQAYKTENPDGSVVERIWQQNIPYQNPAMNTGVNPYIKTEFISLKDSAGTLSITAIKDFNYDKNGNLTQIKEYDWVPWANAHPGGGGPAIPAGVQPKRVTVNTFHNATPDASDSSYNANVYNQPSAPQSRNITASNEVRDNSLAVSRTELFYDNPSTTANVTQVKTWDSSKGSYTNPLTAANSISVSTQYNAYGAPTLTTDAKGIQTQLTYGAINGFTDLYPTLIKTAYGTSVQRTESREYAFSAGLVKRVTDVDNNVATATTFDAFGRPTLVRAAEGKPEESSVATEYSDALRRVIVRADLNTLGDGKLVTVQHYDQLGRLRLRRKLENSVTQSATDETTGIKTQTRYIFNGSAAYALTSNPYRAATSSAASGEGTMGWTRTKKDNGGRIVEVQTFAGSTLPAPWSTNVTSTGTSTTAYDANFTTTTDQAGKIRRSMLDGLTRLVRVDEPDGSNNLGATTAPVQATSYNYDVLDNLIGVTQGTQTRTFVYNSLKRLTSAANPESGTILFSYDNNGNLTQKTDARGVISTYSFDSLNRNTTVNYSNTTANPDVTRAYDGATNGKGKSWYSYAGGDQTTGSSVEKTLVASYDFQGRPTAMQQSFKVNGVWGALYSLSRVYNRASLVTSQTYPSGHIVTYNYDGAGRLADADPQNPAFTGNLGDGVFRTYSRGNSYEPAGQLKQEQFGTTAAVFNKLFYNSRQQLAEVLASTTGGDNSWNRGKIITGYSLQCSGAGCNASDNNGNIRKQETFIPADDQVSSFTSWYQQYDYDQLNRLLRVHEYTGTASLDWQQEYVYDRWGNRTLNATNTWIGNSGNPANPLLNEAQFETGALQTSNRLYAPGDLALPDNQRRMRYDPAGNLTNDTYTAGGQRVYDAENRIVQAWGGGDQWQYYTYNADGQRTRRTVDNLETWQIYGFEGELLAEYASNAVAATPKKEYGYRNGQLLINADGRTNVALSANGGVASASSAHTCCGFSVGGAINGNISGPWGNGEGWNDATENVLPDWFQVDFAGSKTIDEIDVFSLHDNYTQANTPTETQTFSLYGLVNFQVQYWNGSAWTTIPGGNVTGNNKVWRKFAFTPITTTKIRLWITGVPDSWSRLVELQAWTADPGGTNLALNKPATQSTTDWSAPASRGVDGNTDGNFWNNSVTHTATQSQPWWQVDLESVKSIQNINVWNRTDCCGEALTNFYVFVSDNPFTANDVASTQNQAGVSTYYVAGQGGVPSTVTVNRTGRYVRIQLPITERLSVAEVQVFGGGSAAQVRWLVSDQLGTPRMILDQGGSLASMQRHDYLPFGEQLFAPMGRRTSALGYSGGDGVRQQFTQKERDLETGLDYFGARYYGSVHGRFTSVDPVMSSAVVSDPQSLNRYTYVRNRPLSSVDPNGMDDCQIGKTCSFTTNDWATNGVHPEQAQIQVSVDININEGSPDLVTTTSIDPSTVSLGFPQGQPIEPASDPMTLVEQVVGSTTEKMLQLVAATSEMIGEAAYAAMPDYLSFDVNLPLIGGVNGAISKDLEVYGGYNVFGLLGGNLEGATSEDLKFRLSGQVSAGYYLTTELSQQERHALMDGVDLNISASYVTVTNQLDSGGPPAIAVGIPSGFGVSTSHATHLFSLRPLIGKEPIR